MEENIEVNLRKHPYLSYENTSLWDVLNKALSELEQNQDIKLSTPREYVIGYICKQIKENFKNNAF